MKRTDVDIGGAPLTQSNMIYFEPVWKNIGKKKTVPIAVGAGTKFRQSDMAVKILTPLMSEVNVDDLLPQILTSRNMQNSTEDSTYVLRNICGGRVELETRCIRWERKFQWSFIDWASDTLGIISIEEVNSVLSDLVNAGAYPTNADSLGYVAQPNQVPSLHDLHERGLVQKNQSGRWFLSDSGWANVRSSIVLSYPTPLFSVRDTMPLDHLTVYELLMLLDRDGWERKLRITPSKRKPTTMPIPYAYYPDAAKEFFTTLHPLPSYLIALLSSRELFDKGLARVVHGQADSWYKAILDGDLRDAPACGNNVLDNAIADVDVGSDADGQALVELQELCPEEVAQAHTINQQCNIEQIITLKIKIKK